MLTIGKRRWYNEIWRIFSPRSDHIKGVEPIVPVQGAMEDTYRFFGEGNFREAQEVLDRAHSDEFQDKTIQTALKTARFWEERVRQLDLRADGFEKGEYLYSQWRYFLETYLPRLEVPFTEGLSHVRGWVHRRALEELEPLALRQGESDPDLLKLIGRCRKTLGRYEEALDSFNRVLRAERQDAELLAETGDVYALMNRDREAKVFFREAYFTDPQKVDHRLLDSALLGRLAEEVKKRGYRDRELREWMPVYGVILGVLNVKRNLRPIEYGKLRQSIYQLKSELGDDEKRDWLVPRLINRYFWLIDHYLSAGENRETVEEVLMNIKLLDPEIHRQYTN